MFDDAEAADRAAVLAANAAFYAAFRARDYAAMAALWAEGPLTCLHPGWPALLDRVSVLRSFRDILANPQSPPIRSRDEVAHVHGDVALVVCHEEIEETVLVATNVFKRIDGAWRLIHHQAGPSMILETRDSGDGPGPALH